MANNLEILSINYIKRYFMSLKCKILIIKNKTLKTRNHNIIMYNMENGYSF